VAPPAVRLQVLRNTSVAALQPRPEDDELLVIQLHALPHRCSRPSSKASGRRLPSWQSRRHTLAARLPGSSKGGSGKHNVDGMVVGKWLEANFSYQEGHC